MLQDAKRECGMQIEPSETTPSASSVEMLPFRVFVRFAGERDQLFLGFFATEDEALEAAKRAKEKFPFGQVVLDRAD